MGKEKVDKTKTTVTETSDRDRSHSGMKLHIDHICHDIYTMWYYIVELEKENQELKEKLDETKRKSKTG